MYRYLMMLAVLPGIQNDSRFPVCLRTKKKLESDGRLASCFKAIAKYCYLL